MYRGFFYHRSYLSTASAERPEGGVAAGAGLGPVHTAQGEERFKALLSVCGATFETMEVLLTTLNMSSVPRTRGMVEAHAGGVRSLARVFKVDIATGSAPSE